MTLAALLVTLCASYVGYDLYGVLGAVGVLAVIVGVVETVSRRLALSGQGGS